MKKYELKNISLSNKLADSSYLLTGCARSGTSIFGSILGSMENTEYLFESPTLLAFFTQINTIKKKKIGCFFLKLIYLKNFI